MLLWKVLGEITIKSLNKNGFPAYAENPFYIYNKLFIYFL